jgi:NAD(P)-dependent dehydrogenase (short-subunit alcohol dehydrogenase family)
MMQIEYVMNSSIYFICSRSAQERLRYQHINIIFNWLQQHSTSYKIKIMSAPIVLILGAGTNVGQHVARAFAAKGYKVALAARSVKESENTSDQVNVPSDFTDPNSIVAAFAKVKASLGIPSVVVYNAGAATQNDAKNPLSLPLADFNRDYNINTASAFVAAQQAVAGFEQLPTSASRTFIYTGNIMNTAIIAPLLTLGVGKSATAHIIQNAASAYADRGYK